VDNLRTLFCANVPVRQDGNGGFMHPKVIIVDERYVVTGSLNFSTRAETTNDENVIVIDNPDIARLYLQEFDRVWAITKTPDPAKFNCQ
jgi:phosphatidylserine/phosphatidylglycerophosphate/cardiolipin synthase-like enzyme